MSIPWSSIVPQTIILPDIFNFPTACGFARTRETFLHKTAFLSSVFKLTVPYNATVASEERTIAYPGAFTVVLFKVTLEEESFNGIPVLFVISTPLITVVPASDTIRKPL